MVEKDAVEINTIKGLDKTHELLNKLSTLYEYFTINR